MTVSQCTGTRTDGTPCPLASACYRHVTPQTQQQSWYVRADSGDGCEAFWPAADVDSTAPLD